MEHNEFAISLMPKCQSKVNYHSTGLLIGLVVLLMVFSVVATLNAKSDQVMAKIYPSVHVAQADWLQ